jgi:hypothetical protein
VRAHALHKARFVALTSLLAIGWASIASAHQGYPALIDSTLDLTGKDALETVLPQMGCQLCHNSSAGGDQLRAFGNLMVENYGLSPSVSTEEDSTLTTALMGLEEDDPEAVKDLKAGIDPNNDPVVFQNALPTPTYGCSAAAMPRGSSGSGWAAGLALVALFAVGYGRSRRRG